MERVRLSQLVHTRQASRSSSTIQKHTSNHTPRAVRMNDGEKEEALLVRSLRSTASQLWRKHQASPPVEFHTPRLRPKRASILLQESNPRDRSDSRAIGLSFLLLPRTCHLDHPRIISHLFFACSAGSCRAEARRFADLLFVISRYLPPNKTVLFNLAITSVCCLYTCSFTSRLDLICLLGHRPTFRGPVLGFIAMQQFNPVAVSYCLRLLTRTGRWDWWIVLKLGVCIHMY